MKASLQAGPRASRQFEVDRPRTIDSKGEQARVYAAPTRVQDIGVPRRGPLPQHRVAQ